MTPLVSERARRQRQRKQQPPAYSLAVVVTAIATIRRRRPSPPIDRRNRDVIATADTSGRVVVDRCS